MSHQYTGLGSPLLSVYQTHWRPGNTSDWQLGLELSLGVSFIDNIPQPFVQLLGQDLTEFATFTVDSNRCLILVLDLTSAGVTAIVCETTPQMYLNCTASLSADGSSFNGKITQMCTGAVNYEWKGQSEAPTLFWRKVLHQLVEKQL